LFRKVIGIVGLTWLPAATLGGAAFWWIGRLEGGFRALHATVSTGERLDLIGDTALFIGFALLLSSAMAVPLARAASGEGHEPVFAHLSFGVRELRLFISLLVVSLFVGAMLVALALVFALGLDTILVHALSAVLPGPKSFSLDVGETWRGIPLRALVGGAAVAIVSGVLAVFLARLSLLLPALASRGERGLLGKSLRASRGNTWRLFLVLVLTTLPVIVIAAVGLGALMVPNGVALDPAAHAAALASVATVAIVLVAAVVAGAGADALESLASNLTVVPARTIERTAEPIALQPAMAAIHPLATMAPEPAAVATPAAPVPVNEPRILASEAAPEAAPAEPSSVEPAIASLEPEPHAPHEDAPEGEHEPHPDEQGQLPSLSTADRELATVE
jgi:hypothetical protein